jgi:pyridoxamine 5'-phosphate oxidase
MSIADLRKDYMQRGLAEADLDVDPIAQFRAWFAEELAAAPIEPNAMTLATATPDGHPSARMVLLKGFDAAGFVFHTNYEGRKGHELERNPWAALVFYWPELERQVRVEGRVERLEQEGSDAYFASRPTGSQLGAWASRQSAVLPDRAALERDLAEVTARFAGQPVPRPPFWGGYRVVPKAIEFWQGRQDRLHDRLRYRRGADGGWVIERLSP